MPISAFYRGACTTLVLGLALTTPLSASEQVDPKLIAAGKAVAFDRQKGNCLACHMIDDGILPGNSGPPLVAMKARFPNKADLNKQIWDATVRNPMTLMPPFGKHGILSGDEIDKIVEYIYTL